MRCNISMFSQVVQHLDLDLYASSVREHGSDYASKGFTSRAHLMSMMYCHLSGAKSLSEICNGLKSCGSSLNHLGLSDAPPKSTLAYANGKRGWEPFRDLFFSMIDKCRSVRRGKRKFKFKNKVCSVDASIVELCVDSFDWAHYRKTKGAVKLHLVLDHDGYLPEFAVITDGKTHEVSVARDLKFSPGTIVVIDRGYTDYDLYSEWDRDRVFFVSKKKCNAVYDVIEERETPPSRPDIVSDQLIRLKNGLVLRKIGVYDQDKNEVYELITNKIKLGATTIAALYKERWQIEIFFRNLKQHMRIKTFIGTSSNAVMTQIWTALVAILLLMYMKFISTFGWSLSNLVALLRMSLLTNRDFMEWLNHPFGQQNNDQEAILHPELPGLNWTA